MGLVGRKTGGGGGGGVASSPAGGAGFPFLVIEVIMIPLTAGVLDLVERWLKGEQMFSSLQVPFCVCLFCPRG